jgi:hypothetical protein
VSEVIDPFDRRTVRWMVDPDGWYATRSFKVLWTALVLE